MYICLCVLVPISIYQPKTTVICHNSLCYFILFANSGVFHFFKQPFPSIIHNIRMSRCVFVCVCARACVRYSIPEHTVYNLQDGHIILVL